MFRSPEEYLSLSQAAKLVPSLRAGRPVRASTISRWIRFGAKTGSGEVIKLEAVRFPGGWKVTEESLDDFIAKLTGISAGSHVVELSVVPKPQKPEISDKDHERSLKRLRELGFDI